MNAISFIFIIFAAFAFIAVGALAILFNVFGNRRSHKDNQQVLSELETMRQRSETMKQRIENLETILMSEHEKKQ